MRLYPVEQPEKTMSTGPVQRWRSAVRCTRGLDAVLLLIAKLMRCGRTYVR